MYFAPSQLAFAKAVRLFPSIDEVDEFGLGMDACFLVNAFQMRVYGAFGDEELAGYLASAEIAVCVCCQFGLAV